MINPDSICIIYVHYHTPLLLRESINQVQNDYGAHCDELEIIIVDNSASLETSKFSERRIRIITPDHNLGYAAGINTAIENTKAKIFVVLNPDVLPLPGCVQTLVSSLNKYDIVAPRLYLDRNLIFKLPPIESTNFLSVLIEKLSKRLLLFEKLGYRIWKTHATKFWNTGNAINSDRLSGAILSFTRRTYEIVGQWDEQFFLYYEEADWLKRAKNLKLRCSFIPTARAIHLFSQSSNDELDVGSIYSESKELFLRKHFNNIQLKILFWVDKLPMLKKPFSQRSSKNYTVPEKTMTLELSYTQSGYPAAQGEIANPKQFLYGLPKSVETQLKVDEYYLRWIDKNGSVFSHGRFFRSGLT